MEPLESAPAIQAANDTYVAPRRTPTNESEEYLLRVIKDAADGIDVALFILSPDNRLIYANDAFKALAKEDHFPTEVGISIRDALITLAHEHAGKDGCPSTPDEIDDWVERRLDDLNQTHSESIIKLSGGRHIRATNHRMANGYLVAVRIDVTESAEREALLSESYTELSLFKTFLDNVPVATFARDENHRMIYVNETYCKIVGRSAEELVGTTLEDLFGEEADKYRRSNESLARNGGVWTGEETIPCAGGKQTDVIKKLMWLTLADGRRIMTGSMTDISTIKEREAEAEAARRRAEMAEQRLEAVMDAVNFGILVINQETFQIEMANNAINENWAAAELGELESRTFVELLDYNFKVGRYNFTEQEFAAYKANWLEDIRQNSEMPEKLIQPNNGKHFIVKGKPIGENRFMLTYNDISELRQREVEIISARAKLSETGKLMNEALSSMQQGFVVADSRMRILVSNGAAQKMLSLPDGLTDPGHKWTDLMEYCVGQGYFTESMEELTERWRECRASSVPMHMVAQVDNQRWVRLEIKASPDDLRVITMTDITEERERQKNLEQLVARAETADRAKSEFLANMSHEIRTPMNGILGMAELLAKSEMDNKQKTFTDVIVKSGNALLTIINDILDFSKIDAGQMKLREGVFDPLEAVEDVATLLSAAAAEKDVELIIKSSPDLPERIHGDAGRFRQIVTNLVGNAVKFTEKGHVLIVLSCEEQDGEPMLKLDVNDTGIGIPENKLGDIFEKFSQVDGSSTRRHEGTGLGLAITAALINLFGGTIDVTSKMGSGTTFSTRLPLKAAEGARLRKTSIGHPGARILVVDDNEVNRTILIEQLNSWGYDACAAEDGPQGLAVLDAAQGLQVPVHLAILDYHMPGMNGVELARAIRQNAWFDDMPIMFLTSMDMAADEQRFANLNVQAHLMKPARAQLLKTTISEVLSSPIAKSATGSAEHAETSPASQEGEAPAVGGAYVDLLVAEDNEVNQIVFTQFLQQTRYKFHIAPNGLDAFEFWKKHHPSLILMDVSMPIMNGHETTRKIRALEEELSLPRTPIIGVTAHAQESDKELCLAAGMDDYMSKPISPERLQDKLRRWMPAGESRKQA
nr:response regulator [Rhizobium sp. L1K21]